MQIDIKAIKAAAQCAATKDIRYYLCGVLVEFTGKTDRAIVVGTDGHMLFAGLATITQDAGSAPIPEKGAQIIIPIDVCKKVKPTHKNNPFITLSQIGPQQWQLGDILFTPIDGKFPDWRRVVPRYDDVNSAEQVPAYYQPELLMRALAALRAYRDAPNLTPDLYQRGQSAAVMHDGTNECVVVVMPCRPCGQKYQGLNSDFL